MKNRSLIFTLIIGVSILLSSCSSNKSFTFTKRHYTSGYYADRVGKPAAPKTISNPQSMVVSSQANEKVDYANAPHTLSNNTGITTLVFSNKSGVSNVASGNTPAGKTLGLKEGQDNEVTIPVKASNNESQVKQVAESITSVTDRQDRENARSLFWLVITILIILWLIAILSGGWGIGPIINLLLIIAIVLFILWLLRII